VQSNVGQWSAFSWFKCGWHVILRFVPCGSLIDANQKIRQLNQY
jgi:hypothetical protein